MSSETAVSHSSAPSEQLVIASSDPDESTWRAQAFAPGVRHVATDPRFQIKTMASLVHRMPVLSYVGCSGGACFPGPRPYYAVSWSLTPALESGPWNRRRRVEHGFFHVDDPREESWIWNLNGAHVLGLAVDPARFDAYRFESGLTPRFGEPTELFSMATPDGRALAGLLTKLRLELVRPGSVCPTPASASELEDELILALARTCSPESLDGPALGQRAARRAEEVLAADLTHPLSLLEAAQQAEAAPRTLSRAIRKRHGVGPMQFRRRRRMEAACRDLFLGDPEESSVTEVALRYGFNHLGRFAIEYGRVFGELPSETLLR